MENFHSSRQFVHVIDICRRRLHFEGFEENVWLNISTSECKCCDALQCTCRHVLDVSQRFNKTLYTYMLTVLFTFIQAKKEVFEMSYDYV